MGELQQAIDVIERLTGAGPDFDHVALNGAFADVMAAAQGSGEAELGAAVDRFGHLLQHAPPATSAIIAVLGGALVEFGAPPERYWTQLEPALTHALAAAAGLVRSIQDGGFERVESLEDDGVDDPGDDDLVVGNVVVRAVRDAARRSPSLATHAVEIDRGTGALRCLTPALLLLDDEPLLVLHAPTRQGWRMTIGGVADNFQLHMLLVDALVGAGGGRRRLFGKGGARAERPAPGEGLPGRRPDEDLLAVWRGDGPQGLDRPSVGMWNLYQWRAVASATGELRSDDLGLWVWNEGRPADIDVFDGVRTVVLGPASYERSFSSSRFFDLPASLVVHRALEAAEVEAVFARMAAAGGA